MELKLAWRQKSCTLVLLLLLNSVFSSSPHCFSFQSLLFDHNDPFFLMDSAQQSSISALFVFENTINKGNPKTVKTLLFVVQSCYFSDQKLGFLLFVYESFGFYCVSLVGLCFVCRVDQELACLPIGKWKGETSWERVFVQKKRFLCWNGCHPTS